MKQSKHRKGLREALKRQMRFASDEQCEAVALRIESELPWLLREAFGEELESIYNLTSASKVRDLRNQMVTNPVAKALDDTRNGQARQDCIDKKGCKCIVCGFDFEAVYEPVGRNYIEVHHLKPISQTDDEHEVTADDLVPLCANCHAMAHRRSPESFTPEELHRMIYGEDQA